LGQQFCERRTPCACTEHGDPSGHGVEPTLDSTLAWVRDNSRYAWLPMRRFLPALALFALAWLVAYVAGCSPNSVCKIAGPINDPSNRTLRRNIMSFGLGQFCQQMTTRNAPLKLAPDAPVIGRFFPEHCTQRQLDNGDLWVQFDGKGYAFTNLSR